MILCKVKFYKGFHAKHRCQLVQLKLAKYTFHSCCVLGTSGIIKRKWNVKLKIYLVCISHTLLLEGSERFLKFRSQWQTKYIISFLVKNNETVNFLHHSHDMVLLFFACVFSVNKPI